MSKHVKISSFLVLISIMILSIPGSARPGKAVQVDVRSVLNGRAVTTLTGGKLVTWTVGIDGDGLADGYMTRAASLFNGDKNPNALPDDDRFPANNVHPEVVLNYSNRDGANNQVRGVRGAGEFSFAVPRKIYSKMFLFLTSSEGDSNLHITLTYADGTVENRDFVLPDYYMDVPAGDPNFSILIGNLAKWDTKNKMKEADHHNIDALDVHPSAGKVLTQIKVQKEQKAYMVFWGATGVEGLK